MRAKVDAIIDDVFLEADCVLAKDHVYLWFI